MNSVASRDFWKAFKSFLIFLNSFDKQDNFSQEICINLLVLFQHKLLSSKFTTIFCKILTKPKCFLLWYQSLKFKLPSLFQSRHTASLTLDKPKIEVKTCILDETFCRCFLNSTDSSHFVCYKSLQLQSSNPNAFGMESNYTTLPALNKNISILLSSVEHFIC